MFPLLWQLLTDKHFNVNNTLCYTNIAVYCFPLQNRWFQNSWFCLFTKKICIPSHLWLIFWWFFQLCIEKTRWQFTYYIVHGWQRALSQFHYSYLERGYNKMFEYLTVWIYCFIKILFLILDTKSYFVMVNLLSQYVSFSRVLTKLTDNTELKLWLETNKDNKKMSLWFKNTALYSNQMHL